MWIQSMSKHWSRILVRSPCLFNFMKFYKQTFFQLNERCSFHNFITVSVLFPFSHPPPLCQISRINTLKALEGIVYNLTTDKRGYCVKIESLLRKFHEKISADTHIAKNLFLLLFKFTGYFHLLTCRRVAALVTVYVCSNTA